MIKHQYFSVSFFLRRTVYCSAKASTVLEKNGNNNINNNNNINL